MENQNNNEYGQTDPDFIDQNTPVNGNDFQKNPDKESKTAFEESDPDFIDQNAFVDNDNYVRDEDPYHYQEELIEDFKHRNTDSETNRNLTSENTANQEKPKTKNNSDRDKEK
ncbi:hypothetical protein [Flavobacterium sp. RS13.1]|uniref:hypothetical protein n=1 Tax=Flavobacterium sp. RS13.1 TaxID=3400345 RepID=UPI003AAF3D5A